MKRIGLVCNYYILNYGSALQCFATEFIIKDMGYDVETIQFANIPTKKAKRQIFLRLKLKQCFIPKAVIKKMHRLKNNNLNEYYKNIVKERKKNFDEFITSNLRLTEKYNSLDEVRKIAEKYNVIILGSDQLLCPKDIICGYHTLSFVPDNVKRISYAASFGLSELPFLVKNIAGKDLRKFDKFSAREIAGAKIFKELTGKEVPVVVDPTMLISVEKWNNISGDEPIIQGKYIYCYFIGENKSHRKIAKKLSLLTGYKIVSIRHIDEYIEEDELFGEEAVNNAGPKEFINLIKNAEYILADSFHATIFSILFKKNFFVLNRFENNSSGSTNSRIDSLLNILGLEERRLHSSEDITKKYDKKINYDIVNNVLKDWVEESKRYLKDALEN